MSNSIYHNFSHYGNGKWRVVLKRHQNVTSDGISQIFLMEIVSLSLRFSERQPGDVLDALASLSL